MGFLFLDFFQKKHSADFSEFLPEKKFSSEVSTGTYCGEKIILLKPQVFMNRSGISVQSCMNFFKIPVEDIVLVYDDKDMEFQKIRFREK